MAFDPTSARGSERGARRATRPAVLLELEEGVASLSLGLNDLAGKVPFIIGSFTVDTLPSPVGRVGQYARVTDLFGEKVDLVLASQSGSRIYWQPVRPNYARTFAAASMTYEALKTPSSILMTGTINVGVTRTINLGTGTAFPGASLDIRFTGSLLGALNVTGLGLGSAVAVAAGSYRKFVCVLVGDAFEWRQLV